MIYRYSPITVNIVVECQLLKGLYVPFRKDPHPHMIPDSPLGYVAIRVTTMICETSNSTALGSIDKLDDHKR